jgi:hypothetical protein
MENGIMCKIISVKKVWLRKINRRNLNIFQCGRYNKGALKIPPLFSQRSLYPCTSKIVQQKGQMSPKWGGRSDVCLMPVNGKGTRMKLILRLAARAFFVWKTSLSSQRELTRCIMRALNMSMMSV